MINLFVALFGLFLYMCIAYVISLVRKDNGTADIAYGWGFVLVAWTTYALGLHSTIGLFLSVLTTIWAARLSIRIYLRSQGKPEDFRYKKWREEWGDTFLMRSFLQVYMLQGAVIFFVVLPVSLLNLYGSLFGLTAFAVDIGYLGLIIWLKGFIFEVVGDWQLARFMKGPENKGKIMDRGLWHFTRHPNYYGESLMWWGIALTSFAVLMHTSPVLAVLGFIGPVLITTMLLKVSGVPMLEAHFAGNPAWEAYKAKTSVFIPWFPKKSTN
jgi:steroid 5-alpha reductase family enzyme